MKKFSLSLLSFSILTAFSTNAWASDADNPALNPAIQSQTLGEVQVQGQRVSKVRPFSSSPTSDVFISNTDLKKRSNNLGEAIATEAGIHANSFGGGASAPVIRGQEGKRIRILTAGSETLDMSSMSPDHAITADGILAKQVEIFRGASTLMYSSGNSAGVVNVADSKIPSEVPENVTGEAGVRYNSAIAERLTHLAVTAGVGKHLAVHAEGLYKKANDYKTPEYVYDGEPHRQVDNSFSQSKSGSLGVSWVGSQGFLGAAFTQRKDKYGLPAHSHLYDMYEARVMLDNATLRNTYLKYYPFLMDEQHINYNNPGLECKKRTYDWHVNACHNHNSSAAQNH
ncbi:MAG: TonB-dependent receptor plug domain-containing protein, partial [Neisseria sp.]|nr:TonB-dependent receptor plug domain-containing protein [Neisseria sp.]